MRTITKPFQEIVEFHIFCDLLKKFERNDFDGVKQIELRHNLYIYKWIQKREIEEILILIDDDELKQKKYNMTFKVKICKKQTLSVDEMYFENV